MARRFIAATLAFSAILPVAAPAPANAASDIDCEVILCMAGGFPRPGCSAAWSYMYKRITRFPHPLPPYDICIGANGQAYTGAKARYGWTAPQNPAAWLCPPGQTVQVVDQGSGNGGLFRYKGQCHQTTTTTPAATTLLPNRNPTPQTTSIYMGPAQRISFYTRIDIPQQPSGVYRSPTTYIDFFSGFSTTR